MIFANRWIRRVAGFTLALFFFLSSAALAASPSITGVRFGKGTDHDRIVLDVSEIPKYATRTEKNGMQIILELPNTGDSVKAGHPQRRGTSRVFHEVEKQRGLDHRPHGARGVRRQDAEKSEPHFR